MTSRSAALILVVDDDAAAAAGMADALTAAGYGVRIAPNSLEGLIAVEQQPPALIVLDWGLPFIAGHIFLWALRAGVYDPPPVVALVDRTSDPASVCAAGARAVLTQPLAAGELLRVVRGVLRGVRVVTA